jgi:hypothetical protein
MFRGFCEGLPVENFARAQLGAGLECDRLGRSRDLSGVIGAWVPLSG